MTEFTVRRGMNIGGWLSQSKRRGEERRALFGADDISSLAELGFDHLRIPVDEEQLWSESGERETEAWDLLNAALDACEAAGLRVIVDLHILRCHYFNAPERPLFTDPAAPGHFADLWRDLSAGLSDRAVGQVAYELLNEAVAADSADWNRVYPFAYRSIREREADRVIVLGSNSWNQAATFDDLVIPAGDRNLILTFHFYNPMLVTHYQASFVPECKAYDGPISYPGLPISGADCARLTPEVRKGVAKWNRHYDTGVMLADLAAPLNARERTGLPLYCGEFGVIQNAPAGISERWHRDLIGLLESLNIGWGSWNYKGGFGMTDSTGKPHEFLRDLLRQCFVPEIRGFDPKHAIPGEDDRIP